MKNKPLIIAISIIAVIIGGFIVAASMNQPTDTHTDGHSATNSPVQQQESSTQDSQTSSPQADNDVTIDNYAFNPATITVKKGTTVTWTNKDTAEHNVEFNEQPANGDKEGPLLAQGETYSFTFDTVGTFDYICSPHPYMKGTVVVTE